MPNHLTILIPLYEDWESLRLLLDRIDQELAPSGDRASVLAVDDASAKPPPPDLFRASKCLSALRVVRLKVNVGHQRAIAIGLAYIQSQLPCDTIIIMDADGEDRPEDIKALLQASSEGTGREIVFAQRASRSESAAFQIFYLLYRALFRIATGRRIRFGNFSLVPYSLMSRVVSLPDLWNNYAAALAKARIPLRMVACDRGKRLVGKSKMNLVSLILHGLSAISVYSDVFGARALIVSFVIMLLALALGAAGAVVRLTTHLAIPGWATTAVGLSIVAVLQAVTLSAFFVFLILHSRNATPFVPGRDYEYFVAEVLDLPSAKRGAHE
jgi:glycosyltransferase involved in cell wall biosynthesis